MSKESEALKNIVKEISAYKLHGLGDKNWLGIQDIMQDIDVLEQALKQAQKQEKLLELYKELMPVKDELISLAWFDDECDETEEIEINLEKRIKELENGN